MGKNSDAIHAERLRVQGGHPGELVLYTVAMNPDPEAAPYRHQFQLVNQDGSSLILAHAETGAKLIERAQEL